MTAPFAAPPGRRSRRRVAAVPESFVLLLAVVGTLRQISGAQAWRGTTSYRGAIRSRLANLHGNGTTSADALAHVVHAAAATTAEKKKQQAFWGSTHMFAAARVRQDFEPLEVVALHAGEQEQKPGDGDPWFRYKKASDAGTAGHPHFGGLTSVGNFQEDIVAGHNRVRSYGGVPMAFWSEGLAKMAQDRVEVLVKDKGCVIQHSPSEDRFYEAGFEYIGENLYKVVGMTPTGVDVADAWYAELDEYNYGRVGDKCTRSRCQANSWWNSASAPPCTIGHFTQMMWHESRHIGCGLKKCPDEAKTTYIAVCNYGDGGNLVGELPFGKESARSLGFAPTPCLACAKFNPNLVFFAILAAALGNIFLRD